MAKKKKTAATVPSKDTLSPSSCEDPKIIALKIFTHLFAQNGSTTTTDKWTLLCTAPSCGRFRNSTCQKLLKAPFVQAVSSATNNIHLSVVNGSLSLRQASKLWPSRICVRLVLTLETLLRPREIAARWRRPAAIDFIDLMFYSWRSLQAFRESLVPDPLE